MKTTLLLTKTILVSLILLQPVVSNAQNIPNTLTGDFVHEGNTFTYIVNKFSIRDPNFQVKLHTGKNKFERFNPGAVRTYMGTVLEDPEAVVAGYLRPDNTFWGRAYFNRSSLSVEFDSGPNDFRKIKKSSVIKFAYDQTITQLMDASHSDSDVYSFQYSADVPSKVFLNENKLNNAPSLAVEAIEYVAISSAVSYVRDARLLPLLHTLVIRADKKADPHAKNNGSARAVMVESFNNDPNLADAEFYKLMVIGGTSSSIGGVSASTIMRNLSSTQITEAVWSHELSHALGCMDEHSGYGAGHGHMNRNEDRRFTGPCARAMIEVRDREKQKENYTNIGSITDTQIAPYASMDVAVVERGVDAFVDVDVLANDHDSNGDRIFLQSTGTSFRGQPVSVRDDKARYTVSNAMTGPDFFNYTIEDSGGTQGKGVAVLNLQNPIVRDGSKDDLIFNAENASTNARVVSNKVRGQEGTSFLEFGKNDKGRFAQWEIDVPETGFYSLSFRYSNGAMPFKLIVNGITLENKLDFFNTKNDKKWNILPIPMISLRGDITNTIRLEADGGDKNVNIDYLMVTKGVDIRVNFVSKKQFLDGKVRDKHYFSLLDHGDVFGDRRYGGVRYGWNKKLKDKFSDLIDQKRVLNYNYRMAVLMGNNNSNRKWEIELPNGKYNVHLVGGGLQNIRNERDRIKQINSYTNSFNVEGTVLRDNSNDEASPFSIYETTVTVTDGRLTIKPAEDVTGDGATLAFIIINDVVE